MRFLLIVLVCLLCAARTSQAQSRPPGPSEPSGAFAGRTEDSTKRALELGHRGLEAFQAGNWTQAYSAFERAEKLVHSPVFLSYQARAALHEGRWLLARKLFEACATQPLDPNSPASWVEAVELARALQAVLETHMPRLQLSLDPAFQTPISLDVQDRRMKLSDATPLVLPVDPGEGKLRAVDATGRTEERDFVARPARVVALTLGKTQHHSPSPLAPSPHLTSKSELKHSTRKGNRALRRGTVAAWIAAGVGLSVGIVSFAVAWEAAQSIKSRCAESENNVCPRSEIERVGHATRAANLATAGFVACGVAAATGVSLWVSERLKRKATVKVGLAPGGLVLSGRF